MKPSRLLPLAATSGLALMLAACVVEPYGPRPVVHSYVAYDAPPPLPWYDIPPCPDDGMLWVPGYWGWGNAGYYWVAGNWMRPPRVGVVWTPGYWSLEFGGRYTFHEGYWGSTVGYYGGINYGGGYFGTGFYGGRWDRGVWRLNAEIYDAVRVRNVYRERPVININVNGPRPSFAGARDDRRDDRRPFNGGNDQPRFERPAQQQPFDPRQNDQRGADPRQRDQRPMPPPQQAPQQRPFEQQRQAPPPQQQPQQQPQPKPQQRPQEQQRQQPAPQPQERRRRDDRDNDRPGSSDR